MTKDRYGEAIGLWHIDIAGSDFDLKLKMGDGRKLRTILMDDNIRNNKTKLFDSFSDFMFDLIKRDYPEDEEERIKEFIEFNIIKIFEKAQVAFRYATEEDLAKVKLESEKELKKLMSND
jgi:hypothetical protein